MKFLFILSTLMMAFAAHAQTTCTSTCDKYDFYGQCLHQNTCTLSSDGDSTSVSQTTCERYDFYGQCLSEATQSTTRNEDTGATSTSSSSCDKYDFYGNCLYQEKVETVGGCIQKTECDRYDFYGKCMGEKQSVVCN